MKKNTFFILLITSLNVVISYAQNSGDTRTISSSGGNYQLTSATIDWTLGEWVTETYTGDPYLEQGILHAYNIHVITTSERSSVYKVKKVNIWPNPASKYFYLGMNYDEADELILINGGGLVMTRWNVADSGGLFDIEEIPSGTYYIVLLNHGVSVGHRIISIVN